MVSGLQLSFIDAGIFFNHHLCKNIISGLQYVTITHPKIALSVNRVCQYIHAPRDVHWKAVKCILRYP